MRSRKRSSISTLAPVLVLQPQLLELAWGAAVTVFLVTVMSVTGGSERAVVGGVIEGISGLMRDWVTLDDGYR